MSRIRTVIVAAIAAGIVTGGCRMTGAQIQANAERDVRAGKYQEAIIEYRKAIDKDPKNAALHTQLADVYMRIHDAGDAAEHYLRAADLAPDDVDAQLKVAGLLVLGHQFELARLRAQAVLAKDSKNVVAQIIHANALAGLNQLDRAIAEIQQAVDLDPDRASSYSNLGVLQLAVDEPQKAEATFKHAVEVDPKSAQAHLVLASYYWAAGRLAEAERELKRAHELEPAHAGANRALATFYLGTGRAAEAEEHLKTIAEKAPSLQANLALADYYAAMNRTVDALKLLQRIAKFREGFSEARSRMAALAYRSGRIGEAHKLIDGTLARDPNHVRALLTKVEFLVAEHQPDEALPLAKAAVLAAPQSAEAHFALGSLYAITLKNDDAAREFKEVLKLNPRSGVAQMELARLNLVEHPEQAAEYAGGAVAIGPNNVNARMMLVRSLIAKRDATHAETALRPLLATYPKLSQVQTLAGTLYMLKNEPAQARESFTRAVAADPAAADALGGLIALDLGAKQFAAARARVEAGLKQQPNDRRLMLLAIKTYQVTRDLEAEEAMLRRMIEVDPDDSELYTMLGQNYVSRKKIDVAVQEFDGLTKRSPKSVPAQTMMAVLLGMQDKVTEAEERYRLVLKMNPRSVVAANNLAWLYAEQGGDLDTALQLIQMAKEQVPDDPGVNDTMGWIYYKKDMATSAIPPLTNCINRDPKNVFCQYHLGLAYAKAGDTARARTALQAAVTLSPNSDSGNNARAMLASISPGGR